LSLNKIEAAAQRQATCPADLQLNLFYKIPSVTSIKYKWYRAANRVDIHSLHDKLNVNPVTESYL